LITKSLHKHYPVEDINTKSTVGAGDSFNAGLIYACIKHKIKVENLNEISEKIWDEIIAIAIEFASHVCLSTQNCVSLDFARRMKYEAFKQ
jgi:fructokinase